MSREPDNCWSRPKHRAEGAHHGEGNKGTVTGGGILKTHRDIVGDRHSAGESDSTSLGELDPAMGGGRKRFL